MKSVERLTWLQAEVDDLVKRYQKESAQHKKEAVRLRIMSVLLAALITVLLGLKLQNTALTEDLSNVALILSAAITVLSAYEAFFDPRARWVRETVTFARLKDLQRDLRFWASGQDPETIDAEALGRFKSKLDTVLEDTLKYWMKIRGAADLEKNLEAKAELRPKDSAPGH
jgi:hypothetical protein